ncbi:MAG TPA: hypothetical protein DCL21_04725 [Alphaproteobacteria bacterium]|nr:hypothetical protein [Alphaproteobacteria bacterium]
MLKTRINLMIQALSRLPGYGVVHEDEVMFDGLSCSEKYLVPTAKANGFQVERKTHKNVNYINIRENSIS